jgi:hypothetical protein
MCLQPPHIAGTQANEVMCAPWSPCVHHGHHVCTMVTMCALWSPPIIGPLPAPRHHPHRQHYPGVATVTQPAVRVPERRNGSVCVSPCVVAGCLRRGGRRRGGCGRRGRGGEAGRSVEALRVDGRPASDAASLHR